MPDDGKSGFRRRLSDLDQFRTAVERVPFHATDIGCNDYIAVLPPALLRLRLHDLEAAVHHLEHIGGWCAGLNRQMHRYDVCGAKLPREQGWNFHGYCAIH